MTGADEVIVEFYGIPRLRAGRSELRLASGTVAEVLEAIETACPGLWQLTQPDGRLLPHYLLSLDGQAFLHDDPHYRLQSGQRLLLLSADVGG
jgi:sulfur-carrier protein